jgi:hypothetical protein
MPEAASIILHNKYVMKEYDKMAMHINFLQHETLILLLDLDLNTKISLIFCSEKKHELQKKILFFFQVRDISGTFRWAPFLALQSSDSFLTMLLLLSKHSVRCLPVVDFGEGKLVNIITQSAVVHMLAECAGLDWFDNWGNKRLAEVGLASINLDKLVKVSMIYNTEI